MSTNNTLQPVSIPLPKLEEQLLKLVPHPKLQFEIHLVEHCDLNCQMCTHFSPLAQPQFAEIETFERDMKRLKELFGNDVSYIMLLGGEPLLHPQLTSFLNVSRKYFPYTNIILYTNGLKIPNMTDDFWNCCVENKIFITLTRYPVSFHYDQVDALLQKHQVPYQYCNTPGREKKSSHFPLDLNGTQDARKNFLQCDVANRCIFLREGKLYTCQVIANIQHFNTYFHQNLLVSPLDFIDIYQASNAREIMRALATPPPFCRYCNVTNRTMYHEWKVSTKSIVEWT